MRWLIVEDDFFKMRQLVSFVSGTFIVSQLDSAHSVHSAKEHLRASTHDFILLDMSLPSYDVSETETGGRPETSGGRELLGYIEFLGSAAPVIVVTQFEKFLSGDDELGIEQLEQELSLNFPDNFRGIIYFNTASDAWKRELQAKYEELHK